MDSVERLTAPSHEVGESPIWRAREGALYWVDIPARKVHRRHAESGKLDAWTAPQMVACIAFTHAGELVAGLETGIFNLRLAPGGVATATQLAAPVFSLPGMRFNDGRCDRQGRFWAGTMHMDMGAAHAVGNLYRYDARGGLTGPWQHGMLTQNGLAWSPTGDRMYLSDSHPKVRMVWSFDYDIATGVPTNRQVFIDMNQHPGRPDGAAVDVDGCYWTCANDAGLLLRFTPDGKLDRSIALPVKKPSMCAFGGAQLDTLYVTSIRPQRAEDLAGQPDAGAVFAVRPGIQGLPETEFGSMQ